MLNHQFQYLTPSNPVHKAAVRHLVSRVEEKIAARRVELPESAVPVEERVMMRAFSDELHKIAWVAPLLHAARAALPWAIGGELAYEAGDRLLNPGAQHRSPWQIGKDVALSTALHAPIVTGLKGLDKLRRTAPTGSWSKWLSEKSYGPLSFVGSLFDPKAQMVFRGVQPAIEKALGVQKPADPSKLTPAQRGDSAVSAADEDLSPRYLELRKMDPRYVSSRYLS